jgi:aspartate ammonia-lyase
MNDLDKIVDSIEGMEKAIPSAGFTKQVLAKYKAAKSIVSMPAVYAVAAAIALLIALNVWVGYKNNTQNQQSAEHSIEDVVKDYGLSTQTFTY